MSNLIDALKIPKALEDLIKLLIFILTYDEFLDVEVWVFQVDLKAIFFIVIANTSQLWSEAACETPAACLGVLVENGSTDVHLLTHVNAFFKKRL